MCGARGGGAKNPRPRTLKGNKGFSSQRSRKAHPAPPVAGSLRGYMAPFASPLLRKIDADRFLSSGHGTRCTGTARHPRHTGCVHPRSDRSRARPGLRGPRGLPACRHKSSRSVGTSTRHAVARPASMPGAARRSSHAGRRWVEPRACVACGAEEGGTSVSAAAYPHATTRPRNACSSASIMPATSPPNVNFGTQPNARRALLASPCSRSTSAGR